MEKKYIIKLKENEIAYKTVNSNGCPMIGLLHPVPYTEPDLEQVKRDYDAWYEKGLDDAWEAARGVGHCKLWGDYTKDTGTTSVCAVDVLDYYSAYEAIKKLKAYERKKQEEIKIGDEVTAEHGGSTFTVTWMSDRCICGIDSDGRCYSYELNEVDGKTGNHHEIAAVLEKMRGEQDD